VTKADKRELYARFRLSVDNGFRNEYSYVSYRKWGVMEYWEGARITNDLPVRQIASTRIEIWLNWSLHSTHTSYEAAERVIAELMETAPGPMRDVEEYLVLR
jgi:hypothetical protein